MKKNVSFNLKFYFILIGIWVMCGYIVLQLEHMYDDLTDDPNFLSHTSDPSPVFLFPFSLATISSLVSAWFFIHRSGRFPEFTEILKFSTIPLLMMTVIGCCVSVLTLDLNLFGIVNALLLTLIAASLPSALFFSGFCWLVLRIKKLFLSKGNAGT